jgi:hypothetical protein
MYFLKCLRLHIWLSQNLILQQLNVYHHSDRNWSLKQVIKYMTPVQNLTSYSSNIHFYFVLPFIFIYSLVISLEILRQKVL